MSLRLACLVAAVVISSLAPGDALARDPELPRPDVPDVLEGPYPLLVSDLQAKSWDGLSQYQPERIGDMVTGGGQYQSISPWIISRPVAHWVADAVVRGAASSGFVLVPDSDPPAEYAELEVHRFYCNITPFQPSRCRVDLELVWRGGGDDELLWQYQAEVPFKDFWGFRRLSGVPEELAEDIVDSLVLELPERMPIAPAPDDEGGIELEFALIDEGGETHAWPILVSEGDDLCVADKPPRWVSGAARERHYVYGAKLGKPWAMLDTPDGVVVGRVVRRLLHLDLVRSRDGFRPLRRAQLLGKGGMPRAGLAEDCWHDAAGESSAGPAPARDRRALLRGRASALVLVDKRGNVIDLDAVLDRRDRPRFRKMSIANLDMGGHPMRLDDAVEALGDRKLTAQYQRVRDERHRDRVQSVAAMIVGGSLIATGAVLDTAALFSLPPAGAPSPRFVSTPMLVAGGITLGISIPLGVKATVKWRRIDAGRNLEELEDPELLYRVLEDQGF